MSQFFSVFKHVFLMPVALLLIPVTGYGAGDKDDFYEMRHRGEELWALLGTLPYAAEGSGPVMYLFEYSECPYCQRMYKDFNGKNTGMEQRKIFVPINEKTAREAAALGKSRDIRDYHAYMTRRKLAPDFRQDNAAIDAINKVIAATNGPVEAILKQNSWPLAGIRFPQYVWKENGRVFTNAGYSKASFSRAIERNLAGNSKKASINKPKRQAVPKAAIMTQRSPSLVSTDIQGVSLSMSPAEVQRHLNSKGWVQRQLTWTKQDGSSKKTLSIAISPLKLPGESYGKLEKVTYIQQLDRSTTLLDLRAVKDSLENKFGTADSWTVSTPARKGGGASLDDPQGRLSLTFSEFKNVPEMRELRLACKERLIQSGMSTLQANQQAGGVLYHPSGTVPPPPNALDRTKQLCPHVLPQIQAIQKSLIAPTLKAMAFRQGANITLELSWTKPQYDYLVSQQKQTLNRQKKRQSTGKVDL